MKKFNLVTLFLLLTMLVSPIANALPENFGDAYKNGGGEDAIVLQIKELSGFESLLASIFSSPFSIENLKDTYSPGQYVSVISRESLKQECNGNAILEIDVYSAPVGSQTTANFKRSLSTFHNLGTLPLSSKEYQMQSAFKLPDGLSSGIWSLSSYIYCPGNDPIKASIYSTVTEKNFNVKSTTSTSCLDDPFFGEKFCISKNEQINRYLGTYGNYDSDSCKEYPVLTSQLIDCGGANRCSNGQCVAIPVVSQPIAQPIIGKATGISFSQLGTLTNADLVKSFCNSDSECSAGVCIRKEAVGLAAIFTTGTIKQFAEDIRNLFGNPTEQRIDNLLEQSDKTGICLTDYMPGLDVSEGTTSTQPLSQTSKRATLLEEELEDPLLNPTEAEIKDALCTRTTECNSVEGYRVRCVGTTVIEEEFDVEIPTLTGFEKLIEGRFGEEGEGGVCVASKEGTGDFLKIFEGLGKAVGASSSNAGAVGIGIVIGGILLIFILTSRRS